MARHIIWRQLPIDGSVLCDFLDTISSALVVVYRARTTSGVHGVVLPRAWILSVAGLFFDASTPEKEVGTIIDYIKTIEVILRRLYAGFEREMGTTCSLPSNR